MKYCIYCGKELKDEVPICPGCGKKALFKPEPEKYLILWIILSVVCPIAGVCYSCFAWRKKPDAARTTLIVAVIAWTIGIFISMAYLSAKCAFAPYH